MEDNGYACKLTTIGTSTVKTLFAIDYIDLDYNYIGGFYSIGLSGPAFGGGSGYMLLRLPEDISMNPKDFQVKKEEKKPAAQLESVPYVPAPVQYYQQPAISQPVVPQAQPYAAAQTQAQAPAVPSQPKEPAPNVDTIIKYNHAAQAYDKAKAQIAKKKKEEAEAVTYEGVKVFPVKHTNLADKPKTPTDKNELTEYRNKK